MIDELDASATGERRKKIRRRWLLALVAVVAIGAVPAYHGLKTWRAHRLDAQGESLLAARKYQEAMQRAQVAVQLAPADARSLRLMARLLGIGGSDASLILWNKLLAGPGATPGDRNEMLQTALHLGRLDVVENHLKVALDQPPVTAETLRLAAAYSEARGARPQAIKFATDLLQLDPNDRDALLLLSRQLLNSEDSKQRQQAKDILFSLADRQDQSGVDALLLLANNVPLTPAEEQRCLDRLEKHPLKQPDHRFVIANLKIRLAPQNEAAIVTQAVQSTPADDSSLTTLVRWLLQQKEYGRILQLLTRQHAFTSMDLTIPYLDALAFQKRWPELQEILTKEKLPLDPGLIALYRMRAARELHEDRLVPMYWDQALSLANEKPGLLWEIARYAEALGEPAQAMRAYRQLARDNRQARAAYAALIRLAEESRNTARLRDLIKEIAARYPEDREPVNDLAYLDLLLQTDLPQATQKARELVEKYPHVLAFRTTLALANLRNKEFTAARLAYSGVEVDWSLALPGWRAVYAAVLGANGLRDEARRVASAIPLDRLKVEERLLVQPFL